VDVPHALGHQPIRATLYMSLSGVREMSLITTPPPLRADQRPTSLARDTRRTRAPSARKPTRRRQVFYVVPRVEGIEEC